MAKGMIYKRCSCRTPVCDEHGVPVRDDHGRPVLHRLGTSCPRLKLANGTWNPRHGMWNAQIEAPRCPGRPRSIIRRGGLPDRKTAEQFIIDVHILWNLATYADDPAAVRGEITDVIRDELRRRHRLPDYDTLHHHVRTGTPVNLRTTVAEYLTDWLTHLNDVRPGTIRQYESGIRIYLIPHLGHIELARLRRHHVQTMFDAITAEAASIAANNTARHTADRERKHAWATGDQALLKAAHDRLAALPPYRRPPGPARRHRIQAVLRAALSDAVEDELILTNPATHLHMTPDPPHNPTLWTEHRVARWKRTGRLPSPVMIWTPEQTGTFLESITNDPLYALFHLIAHTGLRRCEALALRRSDFDPVNRTLSVTRQLATGPGGYSFIAPKSRYGERTLLLEQQPGDVLRDAVAGLEDVAVDDPDRLIFAQPDGTPLDPDKVYDRFQHLTAQAGLPPIHLHGLRHGAATMARAVHTDPKTISQMLGHADVAFTLRTYGDVPDQLQDQAVHGIADLIASAPQPRDGHEVSGSPRRPRHTRRPRLNRRRATPAINPPSPGAPPGT
jgi:integrase